MFLQNFVKLSAAIRELLCWQRKQNSAVNNTVVATTDSNEIVDCAFREGRDKAGKQRRFIILL